MAKKAKKAAKATPKAKAKTVSKLEPKTGKVLKMKATAAPKAKRKPKAQVLPGMEQVRHVDLDAECEVIADARGMMNEYRTIEGKACQRALVYMHDNDVQTYRFSGVELARVPGEEKLRVRTSKEPATLEVEDDVPGYEKEPFETSMSEEGEQ